MNDALRAMSRRRGRFPWNGGAAFNDIFLDAVRRRGRVYEMGLMVRFKLRTRRLFEDIGKAPMMLLKRKLPLTGTKVGGKAGAKPCSPRRRSDQ